VTRLSVCGMLEVSKTPSILFITIRDFPSYHLGYLKLTILTEYHA
jgi:hypothetical protein